MPRPPSGKKLTEEQKKLVEENLPLLWWFLDKKVLKKNIIQYHEIDDCVGYLMWHYCVGARSFLSDKGVKFGTYIIRALYSGLRTYLADRSKYWSHCFLTDFRFDDGKGDMVNEPEYKPDINKVIIWEDIEPLFDLINMTPMEEQVIFFAYEKKYTYTKIGKIIGITGEMIRQHHKQVVCKLKDAVEKNNIVIEDLISI